MVLGTSKHQKQLIEFWLESYLWPLFYLFIYIWKHPLKFYTEFRATMLSFLNGLRLDSALW